MNRILTINPGSTSTKIGCFDEEQLVFEEVLRHDVAELQKFPTVPSQFEFRKEAIINALAKNNIELSSLTAIACRGGVTKPITSGTYIVTDAVCEFQRTTPYQHPANLASIIGKNIANELGIEAYFVDSPMTYEILPICSYSGHSAMRRFSRGHALNQKATAREYAKKINKSYNELNLIVAHMGGGISVAAHQDGLMIDVNDAGEEGPFSPERTGELPVRQVIDACFSGKYTHEDMKKFIQGDGGLVSYLGHSDVKKAVEDSETDPKAKEVIDAMILQIAQEIGKRAVTLNGKVDQIILTGGIAYSEYITSEITKRVKFIADVALYPGELELEALAKGVLRVLRNEEEAKTINM